MKLDLYQVDAFATDVFGGNPAAVMPLDAWLSDDRMQAIAAENNLSETAYLVRQSEKGAGHYGLRWFTPGVEVPLCGHATLAAAHVLWAHCGEEAERLVFDTKSGDLMVTRDGEGRIVMDFPSNRPTREGAVKGLKTLLGVKPEVLFVEPYVMAVFADEASVRDLSFDVGGLDGLVDPARLIVTAPGSGDIDCVSRFFAPYAGIDEDPVTGSIHTCIVPYWADRLGKRDIVAYQASPRGGTLYCTDAGDRVVLRGYCADYMVGQVTV